MNGQKVPQTFKHMHHILRATLRGARDTLHGILTNGHVHQLPWPDHAKQAVDVCEDVLEDLIQCGRRRLQEYNHRHKHSIILAMSIQDTKLPISTSDLIQKTGELVPILEL
jgi:hypothetical protein